MDRGAKILKPTFRKVKGVGMVRGLKGDGIVRDLKGTFRIGMTGNTEEINIYILKDIADNIGLSLNTALSTVNSDINNMRGIMRSVLVERGDGKEQTYQMWLTDDEGLRLCIEKKKKLKARKKEKAEEPPEKTAAPHDKIFAPVAYKCDTCGEDGLPSMMAVTDDTGNGKSLCKSCNRAKLEKSKQLDIWLDEEESGWKTHEDVGAEEHDVTTYIFSNRALRSAEIDGEVWYSLDDAFDVMLMYKNDERLRIIRAAGTREVVEQTEDGDKILELVTWRGLRELAQEGSKQHEDHNEFYERMIRWLEDIQLEQQKKHEKQEPKKEIEEEQQVDAIQIRKFNNPEFGEIRIMDHKGEPWFFAKDVAKILGYSETEKMTRRLDDDEKTNVPFRRDGSNYQTNITLINESGLYNAIIGSKKPEAKNFRKWVTTEVLPSIRKHGFYATDRVLDQILHDPDFGIQLLTQYKEERNKRRQLESENVVMGKQLEKAQPKVEFFDQVADCRDAIPFSKAAKTLNIPGIGQNVLFRILRKEGMLMKDNEPYQQYMDAGWFRVITQSYTAGDEKRTYQKTLVLPKGLQKLRELLKGIDPKDYPRNGD